MGGHQPLRRAETYFYPPEMKILEGNVYKGVCLSMGRSVVISRVRWFHWEGCSMKGGCCEGSVNGVS